MIISGLFQFLHKQNTAWLLKCRDEARLKCESLTLLIQPGEIVPVPDVIRFVSAFSLADHLIATDAFSTPSADAPDQPTDQESGRIIRQWAEPFIHSRVFPDLDSFMPVLDRMRMDPMASIVTTNGCFDVLHPGHLTMLEEAARAADVFIVLINSDASIRRFKGPSRPIHSWLFRATLLSQLPFIDYVIVFEEDTPLPALETIQPVCHVKGGSFISERLDSERSLLAGWGGMVRTLPMTQSYSTTGLLARYPGPPFAV